MVFIVCVRFHENMSSDFKVMERTRKLLTDTHTHTQRERERKDENIMPPYGGGIIMKRLCQMHRNIQKSQKSWLIQRKFIGYENYPHVLTISQVSGHLALVMFLLYKMSRLHFVFTFYQNFTPINILIILSLRFITKTVRNFFGNVWIFL